MIILHKKWQELETGMIWEIIGIEQGHPQLETNDPDYPIMELDPNDLLTQFKEI